MLVLLLHKYLDHAAKKGRTRMTKKLEDLYTSDSLHEGLWGKVKSGLGKFDRYMDQKMGPIGTVKKAAPPMPPKKVTPNLGQKNVQADAKEPEFGLGRAMVGGAIGSVLTAGNPLGALAGSVLAQKEPLKLFKRWKSKL